MDLSPRVRFLLMLIFIPLGIILSTALYNAFWPYIGMFSGNRHDNTYRQGGEVGPPEEQRAVHAANPNGYGRVRADYVVLNDTNATIKWRFVVGLKNGVVIAGITEVLLVGFYLYRKANGGDDPLADA